MQPVVVYALYLWIVVSVVALVVQQVRRARRFREHEATPAGATSTGIPGDESLTTRSTASAATLVGASAVGESTPPDTRPRRSLADCLAGIRLPCDLMPVAPGGSPTDDSITLATTGAAPEIVGPAIADELERLGYELVAASASRLIARRDTDVLTLDMILGDGEQPPSPGLAAEAVLIRIGLGEHRDRSDPRAVDPT